MDGTGAKMNRNKKSNVTFELQDLAPMQEEDNVENKLTNKLQKARNI